MKKFLSTNLSFHTHLYSLCRALCALLPCPPVYPLPKVPCVSLLAPTHQASVHTHITLYSLFFYPRENDGGDSISVKHSPSFSFSGFRVWPEVIGFCPSISWLVRGILELVKCSAQDLPHYSLYCYQNTIRVKHRALQAWPTVSCIHRQNLSSGFFPVFKILLLANFTLFILSLASLSQ